MEGQKKNGGSRAAGKQKKMPLADRLLEYEKQRRISFHVPGHKGSFFFSASEPLSSLFSPGMIKADITEIDGFDDLHHPQGIILEAERLAAELFGADETFFLVNGTTSGVAAAVSAVAYQGAPVLVCRHCHESVIRGLILGGGQPVYLEESFDEELGIPAGVSRQSVQRALERCPQARALVITHPSYYGTCSRLQEITDLCHSFGTAVIADEAHGAQLYFSDQRDFPGALEAGCDISVQSTHKMLGSLTQSSMLHVRGDLIDRDRLRSLAGMMNSTSPSYLLMASLDAVRHEMALRGKDIWPVLGKMTAAAADEIAGIDGIRCVREYRNAEGKRQKIEGSRLLISAAGMGISGRNLYEILAREYRIDAEFADEFYVIAVAGSGTQRHDFTSLREALTDFSEKRKKCCGDPCFESSHRQAEEKIDSLRRRLKRYFSLRHEAALSPRDAFFSPSEKIPLREAAGRTAARSVSVYPPGIPVLCPGEVITEEICRYLTEALKDGCHIHGIAREGETFFIRAVTEQISSALFGIRF